MNMQQLLQKVLAGQTSFDPPGHSEEDLRKFQLLATLIMKAEELGYLIDVLPHQESETGKHYYDTIVVGGITESGRDVAG